MIICVYAIVSPPPRPLRATGMRGERLDVVATGSLAAVVGRMSRRPAQTRTNLVAYDRSVAALARRVPAILPARFCTCFDEQDEITFILRSRAAALRRALAMVRGRVQMTVRMPDPGVTAVAGSPLPAADSLGAAYLRARAADVARERDVAGFEPVRHAVRRWVRGERVERRAGVVTVYHLVPRGSVDAYVRAMERSADRAGLRVRVTGPFAPYAFTTWER